MCVEVETLTGGFDTADMGVSNVVMGDNTEFLERLAQPLARLIRFRCRDFSRRDEPIAIAVVQIQEILSRHLLKVEFAVAVLVKTLESRSWLP